MTLAQLQMAINISALPVSLGPISEDLGAPATAAATALLVYSLFVAAFVMPGAKIGKLVGERRVLQVSVVAHGMAMGLMATSTDTSTMNIAQAIAGLAAAALGAALVSVVAVGLLGIFLASAFTRSELPADLHVQALFGRVDFVSNDELRSELVAASATPEQVEEAVAINEEGRLRALRASFLIVGGISLSAIFPAARLPKYAPGELVAEDIVSEATP